MRPSIIDSDLVFICIVVYIYSLLNVCLFYLFKWSFSGNSFHDWLWLEGFLFSAPQLCQEEASPLTGGRRRHSDGRSAQAATKMG